jgi:glycosyltransferase involved in cell wall biosynthesis
MQDLKNEEIIVSICITAYNHGKYIAQALDSVLMQKTDFKYEIVVGEDCSTDNTREVLLAYKAQYPDKVKLLLHEKNMGGKKNLITTLKNCSGMYIAMLDGDDYWIDPEKLQIQIDLMEKNPDCYMSFHPAKEVIGHETSNKIFAMHSNENKIFTASEVIVGRGEFCPTASTVFRREGVMMLLELKLFHDAPVGDYFMQIFGSLHGGALFINRVMSIYRKGISESWSSSMADVRKREVFTHHMIKTLDELDVHLNKKYQDEIKQVKSHYYFKMSLYYLRSDMFAKFKENIELSFSIDKLKSLFLVVYYLRAFPRIAKFIVQLKNK